MVFQKAGIATSVINLVEKAVHHRERLPTNERLQSLSKIVKTLSRAVKINPDLFSQGLDRFPYRIRVERAMKKEGIQHVVMKKRIMNGWNFFLGKFYPPKSLTWLSHPFSDEFSVEITDHPFYRGANIITASAYKPPSYCWKELSKIPHHGLYDCFGYCSEKNAFYNCEQAIFRALEGIVDSKKAQAVNLNNWHRFPEGNPLDRSETKKPGLKEGIELNPGPGKKNTNKNKKRRPNTRVIRNPKPANFSKNGAPFDPIASCDIVTSFSGELSTGAASFNILDFRANDLDDIFGAGGSEQGSGYVRMMAIYGLYRPIWIEIHATFFNRETDQEIGAGIGFSDTQPSTTLTSYTRINDFFENTRLTRSYALGRAPGKSSMAILEGRKRYYWKMPFAVVAGLNSNYMSDNSFQAAYGAGPSNTIWFGLAVWNLVNGVTIPNGVAYRLQIKIRSLFYSIRPDQEIFMKPKKSDDPEEEDKTTKITRLLEEIKRI